MNIKSLLGPQISPSVRSIDRVDRGIHSDQSHDRDANGQQTFGDNQKEKPPMSDEQIEKSIELLRQLPAVKEHKWTVHLEIDPQQKKFVLIKDNLGQLIRRIPEKELWSLRDETASQTGKGQLLKKTA